MLATYKTSLSDTIFVGKKNHYDNKYATVPHAILSKMSCKLQSKNSWDISENIFAYTRRESEVSSKRKHRTIGDFPESRRYVVNHFCIYEERIQNYVLDHLYWMVFIEMQLIMVCDRRKWSKVSSKPKHHTIGDFPESCQNRL